MIETFTILLIILMLNSLAIWGIEAATDYDTMDDGEIIEDSKMIGWKLRYWSLKYIGKFYSKPLFTCPICMSSVHSTYLYLFFLTFVGFQLKWICFYPLYILSLAGLNKLLSKTVFK